MDSADAPVIWKQGKYAEVAEYCMKDCQLVFDLWKHGIEHGKVKGFSIEKAASDAKRSFVDYDINAPLINTMRNSVTPFLAYTYRIVPLLGETAVLRPWKFAKYMALGYGLNAAGGYFAGVMKKQKELYSQKVKKELYLDYQVFLTKVLKLQ